MTAQPGQDPEDGLYLGLAPSPAEPTGDAPEIRMDPAVAEHIERFAATDTSRELAGVLLGEVLPDGPRPRVHVLAAIEAKHTQAVQTSVTFTHDTWEDIHRVREEQYPHLRIVGWFHTHPGFGIFLSRWDLFIQHNFFNLPWEVAYVVDPLGGTRGFFRWENGRVAAVEPPPIETAPAPAVPVRPTPATGRAAPPAPVRARRRAADAALGFAVGALVAAACLLPLLRARPPKVIERVIEQPATVSVPSSAAVLITEYTVRPGDSLWAIAEAKYGDGRCARALQVLNRLPDPDRLPAGATLRLPREDLARLLSDLPAKDAAP